MTATAMTIFSTDGEKSPLLQLDRATKEALAVYVQQSFPAIGRRKAIERLWNLRPDEARSVLDAKASASTLDRIWKHPNGGWRVILPVFGAVCAREAAAERQSSVTRSAVRVAFMNTPFERAGEKPVCRIE